MPTTQTETVADLIREAMRRKGYTSLNQVHQASGGELQRATLSSFMNGRTRTLRASTIDALVTHLGIPRRRLLAALGTPAPGSVPTEPFTLPAEANLLTTRERRIITDMVYALLAARQIGNGTPH